MIEKGAVLTATELEGWAPSSDWSRWVRAGRAPVPAVAPTFASSWREDLEHLVDLGVGAVVVTLEWARLVPEQGRFDGDALEDRRALLAEIRRLGLTTWACLVDGTLPGWFADDEGGFLDERSRQVLWPRHVDWIGEHFGDLVDGWIPQREPLWWALRRYLRGQAPPGRRDPTMAAEAVRAAMLAEGEAWRLLRGTAPVATYQTARPVRPAQALAGGDDLKARPRAQNLERLVWHPWLAALTEGRLVAGHLPERRVDHLRGAFDRVVVELRPGLTVDAEGRWEQQRPDPAAMADMVRRVADEIPDRPVVAAGSLANVVDDGRSRPDHLQAVLDAVAEAAEETSVVGWWQSSPIDGYHWGRGDELRPGLLDRDRSETPAASTFRHHGV